MKAPDRCLWVSGFCPTSLLAPRLTSLCPTKCWREQHGLLMRPWHGPQFFCKLYSTCAERRGDSHRAATGSLRSGSHDRGGARGVESSVREKICEAVHRSEGPETCTEVHIRAAIVRWAGLLEFQPVIPEIWSKNCSIESLRLIYRPLVADCSSRQGVQFDIMDPSLD